MKISLFRIILVVLFAQFNFGQSVRILPRRIVYNRPNIKADKDSIGGHRFTITYPKVFGANSREIENLLSYEKAFDFKLEDEFKLKQGMLNLTYKVLYNANNILSIKLIFDAYTFSDLHYSKFISINTENAELLEPGKVFINLPGLASECRKSQLKAIAEIKKRFSPENYGEVFDDVNFTPEELRDFTVNNRGITFHYPYTFGRTSIIYEPNSDYFFSWKQLKPFIKPSGLLGRFVR